MILPKVLGAVVAAVAISLGTANAHVAQHLYARDELDDFITKQREISITGVLANIGADGSKASGAAAGAVVASPSKSNPDCKCSPF